MRSRVSRYAIPVIRLVVCGFYWLLLANNAFAVASADVLAMEQDQWEAQGIFSNVLGGGRIKHADKNLLVYGYSQVGWLVLPSVV